MDKLAISLNICLHNNERMEQIMKNLKKILALLVAAVLVLSFSVVAFAAGEGKDDGKYRPSADQGIRFFTVYDADGVDVTSKYTLTYFKDRGSLSEEDQKNFEDALDAIDEADSVNSVAEGLDELADGRELAISDLFYLVTDEDVKHPIKLVVKEYQKSGFVGAINYQDGHFVKDEAENESFTVTVYGIEKDGPVAFLARTYRLASPATGESVPYGFFAGALVLACAAAFFFIKSRKAEN